MNTIHLPGCSDAHQHVCACPRPCVTPDALVLQLAMPLSRSGLGSKSEKDLASFKRSKSAVRLEDEETVVVDVTRLHRKEVG